MGEAVRNRAYGCNHLEEGPGADTGAPATGGSTGPRAYGTGVWGSALRRIPAWDAERAASAACQRGQAESIPLGENGPPVCSGTALPCPLPPRNQLFPSEPAFFN